MIIIDVNLGFLIDGKLNSTLFFTNNELGRVKRSNVSRDVLDKLSKVKGRKVRKSLLHIIHGLSESLIKGGHEKEGVIYLS